MHIYTPKDVMYTFNATILYMSISSVIKISGYITACKCIVK